jgi:NADH-quinone oxidoreductase subunit K
MSSPETICLVTAAFMFTVGTFGICVRRSAIVMFMCVELMLNAVNLTFVTFSQRVGNLDGQVVVFFTVCVAAVEAAVGLALIISVFRSFKSIQTNEVSELRM